MERQFHWLDYVVFIIMLAISLGIGLWYAWKGQRKRTTEEYLMGERALQVTYLFTFTVSFIQLVVTAQVTCGVTYEVTLSMVVSVISTNTLIGLPAEVYSYGIQFAFFTLGSAFGPFFTARFLAPVIYPLKMTSVHEYLELRFGSKSVRLFGTFTFLTIQITYMGCVMFGPAISLNIVADIHPVTSLLVVSILATGYTTVGGIKAVVWTDAFQALVMLTGMITIIIVGSNSVGGFAEVWSINDRWGRIYVDMSWDLTTRMTLWSMLLNATLYWMGAYGVNQVSMQRYCAVSTLKKSKFTLYLNGPLCALFQWIAILNGMVAFAYYASKGCDPMEAGILPNANQILPLLIMELLNYPGLVGLLMSSLFCASLSTVSSSLNSMAAVLWEDVLKEKLDHLAEAKKTLITKTLVVAIGVLCTAVSYLVLNVGGNLVQVSLSFFGAALGPLTGLFLLGTMVPFANWKGTLCGGIISLSFNMWLMFGQMLNKSSSHRLPGPTDQCEDYFEHTVLDVNRNTTTGLYTSVTNTSNIDANNSENSVGGVGMLYAISYVWYTTIGILLCMVIGCAVSLLTGCEGRNNYRRSLLCSCVQSRKKDSNDIFDTKEVNNGKPTTDLHEEMTRLTSVKLKEENEHSIL